MQMLPPAIAFLLGIPLLLSTAVAAPEVGYDLDQFGAQLAVISLHAAKDSVSTVSSADGKVFKLHRSSGVFVDQSPLAFDSSGIVRAVNQLRGDSGVDLAVSFKSPVTVEGHESEDGVRFVFVALENSEKIPASTTAAHTAQDSGEKIDELRGLVRDLTLEVFSLKKELLQRDAELERLQNAAHKTGNQ